MTGRLASDGHGPAPPSPTRASPRGTLADACHARPRRQGRRARGDGDALSRTRAGEILEANAATWRPGAREGSRRRAARPAEARRRRGSAAIAGGRAQDRRAPRPGRRDDRGQAARERPRRQAVRVPLGVVAVVYEARPNVTIDCSALCLKSGNAIVLRGSSTAARSNAVLAAGGRERGRVGAGFPRRAISLVAGGDRDELRRAGDPGRRGRPDHPARGRGAEGGLKEHATVPVMYAAAGQLPRLRGRGRRPRRRAWPSRSTRRSSARVSATRRRRCSCTPASRPELPAARCSELRESGVELRVDGRARALAGGLADSLTEATEEDWATEFHALILAVKVVDSWRRRSST